MFSDCVYDPDGDAVTSSGSTPRRGARYLTSGGGTIKLTPDFDRVPRTRWSQLQSQSTAAGHGDRQIWVSTTRGRTGPHRAGARSVGGRLDHRAPATGTGPTQRPPLNPQHGPARWTVLLAVKGRVTGHDDWGGDESRHRGPIETVGGGRWLDQVGHRDLYGITYCTRWRGRYTLSVSGHDQVTGVIQTVTDTCRVIARPFPGQEGGHDGRRHDGPTFSSTRCS